MSDFRTKHDEPRHGALPVGVLRMGTSGEAHVLVRARERNVEPCQESVDV